MSAYPPLKTVPGESVPAELALAYLSSYLKAAKTSPYLLPNARLEASGPTAGSSSSSITIHNLQRVEAGLRGEWLAPKIELEEGNVEVAKGMDDGVNQEEGGGKDAGEGWMDLEDYQREQSVDGPEQAQEEIGVEDGDDVEEDAEVVEEPMMSKSKKTKRNHEQVDVTPVKLEIDRAARKKAKKDRMPAERKIRAEQRLKVSRNDA